MMNIRAAACCAALVTTAAVASAADQSTADLDRIREKLAHSPQSSLTLVLPELTPTFHVRIEERNPFQDIFDVPAWMPEKPGWRPPAAGFDVMSLVGYAVRSVKDAKRGHDERAAREDVQRVIAEYCRAQPDNGTGIAICSSSAPLLAPR